MSLRPVTNEAKQLLKLLYSLYLSRRKEGKGRAEANSFSSVEDIQKDYLYKMSAEDVFLLCRELKNAEYLNAFFYEPFYICISITDDALQYCESKFSRNIEALAKWVIEIAGALPF